MAGGELIGFGSSPSVKPVPDLQRALPAACLFVASLSTNVPDNILHGDLEKQFSPFGLLTEVKVVRDHFKRPYAFVQFEVHPL